jgi:hypothetical protein
VVAFQDRARQHLYGVRAAVRDIELAVPSVDEDRTVDSALRRELSASAESYWRATRALALTTVAAGYARDRGDETNQRFGAVNRSFTALLELEKTRINSETQERLRASELRSTAIAVVGSSLARSSSSCPARCRGSWHARSRRRSRSSRSRRAGRRPRADRRQGRVQRMTHAVIAFRRSLLELREGAHRVAG